MVTDANGQVGGSNPPVPTMAVRCIWVIGSSRLVTCPWVLPSREPSRPRISQCAPLTASAKPEKSESGPECSGYHQTMNLTLDPPECNIRLLSHLFSNQPISLAFRSGVQENRW